MHVTTQNSCRGRTCTDFQIPTQCSCCIHVPFLGGGTATGGEGQLFTFLPCTLCSPVSWAPRHWEMLSRPRMYIGTRKYMKQNNRTEATMEREDRALLAMVNVQEWLEPHGLAPSSATSLFEMTAKVSPLWVLVVLSVMWGLMKKTFLLVLVGNTCSSPSVKYRQMLRREQTLLCWVAQRKGWRMGAYWALRCPCPLSPCLPHTRPTLLPGPKLNAFLL